jgi:hypothetical protein
MQLACGKPLEFNSKAAQLPAFWILELSELAIGVLLLFSRPYPCEKKNFSTNTN